MKKPSVTYEKLYRTRTPEERLRALLPGLLAKDQLPKALAPSAAAPLAVLPYTLRKESNRPDGRNACLAAGGICASGG